MITVIDMLLARPDAKTATKYISPNLIQRATRRHKFSKRARYHNFVYTMGQPNYLERKFIKMAIKAGVKFPIRKILIKPWPIKRTK